MTTTQTTEIGPLYPPKGFREDPDMGYLRCPHRDLYCCATCAVEHDEIVESFGHHFWISDPAMRAEFAAITAESYGEDDEQTSEARNS